LKTIWFVKRDRSQYLQKLCVCTPLSHCSYPIFMVCCLSWCPFACPFLSHVIEFLTPPPFLTRSYLCISWHTKLSWICFEPFELDSLTKSKLVKMRLGVLKWTPKISRPWCPWPPTISWPDWNNSLSLGSLCCPIRKCKTTPSCPQRVYLGDIKVLNHKLSQRVYLGDIKVLNHKLS
jgi:hypothetical protein